MENIQIGRVTRLGTGLAFVIPQRILRAMDIKQGDSVVITVYDKNIFAVRRLTPDELRNLKPGKVVF